LFDCRITASVDTGSHGVLFCSVIGIDIATETSGLVYFARSYHTLPHA
jgi:flavin reductase